MYSYSSFPNRLWFLGTSYNQNQKIIHIKPIAPVIKNALLHPYFCAMKGTVSGATIAPIFDPELKIPVASARSLFGNHSATVLIAAGKFPASVTPSADLAIKKPVVL